jgi:CRP-like cAMP-binding protein
MAERPGDLVVSPAMQEQLRVLGTALSKAKGSVLFRHGDPARGVFLICSGKVRLSLDGANSSFPPRVIGPGSVAGLPASVAGSPYSLTAEVVEDAELAFVPRVALLEWLQRNPQLCFEVMDILSGEISQTRSVLKRGAPVSTRRP